MARAKRKNPLIRRNGPKLATMVRDELVKRGYPPVLFSGRWAFAGGVLLGSLDPEAVRTQSIRGSRRMRSVRRPDAKRVARA